MALLEEQFTETLDAGAPDITYQGNEGKEQQIARSLWDQLPNEIRMQFGSFQQFFSSGAWKEVLARLQQAQQQVPERIQETETIQTQPQQGLGSMMPAQMADGGMLMASASDPMDDKDQIAHRLFGKGLHELTPDEEMMLDEWMEDKAQKWGGAYGGIAGADGRRQYGIGSWFQKKIMDPIKKNPLITAAVLGAGSNYFDLIPGQATSKNWISNLLGSTKGKSITEGLGNVLKSPEWMIPAASLVAGAFAKPEQQLEGGAMSRGAGINLQDIAKLANITDEKQGQAIGLNFLPEASARKYSPEEMALTYSQAGKAQGGRIGYANGGDWDADWDDVIDPSDPDQPDPNWQPDWDDYLDVATMDEIALEFQQEFGYDLMLAKPELREWYINKWKEKNFYDKSEAPAEKRVMAQEGGLMSLGGMEMDLRGGGFVPLGAKEKADDVPARLSKNEFVFTADAVRAAGGGDVDAGADKMYNTMKQLESRVG